MYYLLHKTGLYIKNDMGAFELGLKILSIIFIFSLLFLLIRNVAALLKAQKKTIPVSGQPFLKFLLRVVKSGIPTKVQIPYF